MSSGSTRQTGAPLSHKAQNADDDKVHGYDKVEQPGNEQDEYPGYQRDQRLERYVNGHGASPFVAAVLPRPH